MMEETKKQLEAVLFSSGRAMTTEELSEITSIPKKDVKKSLDELKKDYDSKDSSLAVMQEGELWKLNIREKYVSLVTKIIADTELSKTVLETLGVIAWKAPMLQSEVVNIRSGQAYDHIKELVDLGFIKKEKQGRSFLVRLTEKFFEYFDVPSENAMKEVLKEVIVPEKKEKLGVLEVVAVDDEELKKEKTLEDVKKELEQTFKVVEEEEQKQVPPPVDKEFLENINKRIDEIARKNDELDHDESFRRKTEETSAEEAPNKDSSDDVEITCEEEKPNERKIPLEKEPDSEEQAADEEDRYPEEEKNVPG